MELAPRPTESTAGPSSHRAEVVLFSTLRACVCVCVCVYKHHLLITKDIKTWDSCSMLSSLSLVLMDIICLLFLTLGGISSVNVYCAGPHAECG